VSVPISLHRQQRSLTDRRGAGPTSVPRHARRRQRRQPPEGVAPQRGARAGRAGDRDRVREVCPEFPEHPDLIHWSVPDPNSEGDTDDATYPVFERTLVEIETRVGYLLQRIATQPQSVR
jgi:hypothetical protein